MKKDEIRYAVSGNIENGSNVLFLLHGYGSNHRAMLDAFISWQDSFCLVSIAGLEKFENDPNDSAGLQWFSINDHNRISKNILHSAKVVYDFIKSFIERYSIDRSRVGILGFSQGGYVALVLSSIIEFDIGGFVCMSSGINRFDPALLSFDPNRARKYLLVHGSSDSVVDVSCSIDAKNLLEKCKSNVRLEIVENLGHKIYANAKIWALDLLNSKGKCENNL